MAEPEAAMPPAPWEAPTDALWDNWDIPPRTPAIPQVHLHDLEGPMDLLLYLAERQRLELAVCRVGVLLLGLF